ncbi:MAG: hypothetical protein O7F71_00020 [Gammaproteobacteria bacterium]|nr:hypothetical protein [Gammaproteobacteria bacterium]
MSNSTLKKDVSRYFDERLRAAGSIAFDDVAEVSRNTWTVPAIVSVVVLVGIIALLWPPQTPTLTEELLATTHWQSDTDAFLDYEGRHFLYELPDLEMK